MSKNEQPGPDADREWMQGQNPRPTTIPKIPNYEKIENEVQPKNPDHEWMQGQNPRPTTIINNPDHPRGGESDS